MKKLIYVQILLDNYTYECITVVAWDTFSFNSDNPWIRSMIWDQSEKIPLTTRKYHEQLIQDPLRKSQLRIEAEAASTLLH